VRYLLDTNVCIDYLSGRHPQVARRLRRLRPRSVAVSAIAAAELRYGAEKIARAAENGARLDALFEDMAVLDFDPESARHYGRLRAALETAGTPIGPNDMLIAAQALAHDLVLVSANEDEFRRVAGLRVENWRE
jgi:tRNA(fMet)-specific endonuclease VapC